MKKRKGYGKMLYVPQGLWKRVKKSTANTTEFMNAAALHFLRLTDNEREIAFLDYQAMKKASEK